jgi:hypothetical protein
MEATNTTGKSDPHLLDADSLHTHDLLLNIQMQALGKIQKKTDETLETCF